MIETFVLTPRTHHKKKPSQLLQGTAFDICIRITPNNTFVLTDLLALDRNGKRSPRSHQFETLTELTNCLTENVSTISSRT